MSFDRCLLAVEPRDLSQADKSIISVFLFGLVWQYSTNQNQYNESKFKVMASYLQQ